MTFYGEMALILHYFTEFVYDVYWWNYCTETWIDGDEDDDRVRTDAH